MNTSDSLESRIGVRLNALERTVAAAESCSGGLIAHRLTNVPGASAYFLGGVVAYCNEAKCFLLGVEHEALAAHGAVSEIVATRMAEGVRRRFGADYGVACTGIAGPGGGTAAKPVGLVYIAVAFEEATKVARHVFSGSRLLVKEQTAEDALAMLLENVE